MVMLIHFMSFWPVWACVVVALGLAYMVCFLRFDSVTLPV